MGIRNGALDSAAVDMDSRDSQEQAGNWQGMGRGQARGRAGDKQGIVGDRQGTGRGRGQGRSGAVRGQAGDGQEMSRQGTGRAGTVRGRGQAGDGVGGRDSLGQVGDRQGTGRDRQCADLNPLGAFPGSVGLEHMVVLLLALELPS